jgi:O-acetyl-ADP-ribose deacetylase (regulator of RNase III)
MTWMGGRVEIVTSDITVLDVDAIVNAANSTLLGGGGVDGAIHRAAGPELRAECERLGGARTGEAKVTRGYRLAPWIIHAVGPVWSGGKRGEDAALASCYRESLARAREVGARSLAFPAISTGTFGFPLERATRIALREVRSGLDADPAVARVVFCCYSDDDRRTYERLAAKLLVSSR